MANTRLDRSKAYWAYKELGQFAYPRWSLARDRVGEVAAQLEDQGEAAVAAWRRRGRDGAAEAADAHADAVVTAWQDLYAELLTRFSDGYEYDGHETSYLGYPAWWLEEVGYMNGTAQPCHTPTGTC